MKSPLSFQLLTLLKENKIYIDEEEFDFQLNSHPTFPSLHSVTGVLDHFFIKNFALEVPRELEVLEKLPECFLAFLKSETLNGYALVYKQDKSFILFLDEKHKEELSYENFLNVWSGILVVIDDENQEEFREVRKNYFSHKNLLIVSLALLSIAFLFHTTLFPAIHFLLTLLGLSVCTLILLHELGVNSKLLNTICHEGSKSTSCNAVLNSKGSKLFGFFKLSDIGIVYFISLLLLWMVTKISNSNFYSIYLISLLAVPFTFFSVYYQFRVVKKWCLLCLSVVSILWLQAASLVLSKVSIQSITLDSNSIITSLLCFIITFAVWQFISSKLKKEQELNSLKVDYYKFKKNYNIFNTLLSKSEQINTKIDIEKEIVYYTHTNCDHHLEVVIITNPLCGFCKEAHALAEKLLELKGKEIKIVIRFNVSENPVSNDNIIARRLINIYKNSKQGCLKALHDIYSTNSSVVGWFEKWGDQSTQEETDIIHKEKGWCKSNRIDFTPEILVNGRSLPKEYNRTDLLYFIDELIDEEIERINSASVEESFSVQNNN